MLNKCTVNYHPRKSEFKSMHAKNIGVDSVDCRKLIISLDSQSETILGKNDDEVGTRVDMEFHPGRNKSSFQIFLYASNFHSFVHPKSYIMMLNYNGICHNDETCATVILKPIFEIVIERDFRKNTMNLPRFLNRRMHFHSKVTSTSATL